MKKVITIFTIIILVVAILSFPTYAIEDPDSLDSSTPEDFDPMDSRYLPPQLLEQIDLAESELTVKIYNTHLPMAFYAYATIDELVASFDERNSGYIHITDSGNKIHAYQFDENGACIGPMEYVFIEDNIDNDDFSVQEARIYRCTLHEFQTGEAIKTISPDITVQNVYFIWGETSYTGTAIYYKTNLGDYVYFCKHWVGERLFTAEAFWNYQKAIHVANREAANAVGGSHLDTLDLSVYDYRSPDFNPDAPFPKLDPVDPLPSTPVSDSDIAEVTPDNSLYLWIGITAGVLLLTILATFIIFKVKRSTSSEKP